MFLDIIKQDGVLNKSRMMRNVEKHNISNKIVFQSSVAKILIIVLFLKIMFIMDLDDLLHSSIFLVSFRPCLKLPRHNCRPVASHHCATAPVENRCCNV
jgi:hypothetical protein